MNSLFLIIILTKLSKRQQILESHHFYNFNNIRSNFIMGNDYSSMSHLCYKVIRHYGKDKVIEKIRHHIETTVRVYDECEDENKQCRIKNVDEDSFKQYPWMVHEMIIYSGNIELVKCLAEYVIEMKIQDVDSYMQHFELDDHKSCEINLFELCHDKLLSYPCEDIFIWFLEQNLPENFIMPTKDECIDIAIRSCDEKDLEILAALVRRKYIKYTDFPEEIRKKIRAIEYQPEYLVDIMGIYYDLDYCVIVQPNLCSSHENQIIKHSLSCQINYILMDAGIDQDYLREFIITQIGKLL